MTAEGSRELGFRAGLFIPGISSILAFPVLNCSVEENASAMLASVGASKRHWKTSLRSDLLVPAL